MKTEFLKGLGLTDEQIQSIQAESGKEIQKYKDENTTLKADNDNKKTLLEQANTEIDSYKSMDIDAIKKSADDYKAKYETMEKDYKAKLEQIEYDNKLEKYVDTLKLKNDIYKKEVVSRIKEKDLKFDGDKILGADEVVNSFKEQYTDAFIEEKQEPVLFAGSTPGMDKTSGDSTLRAAMGLAPKKAE